MATANMHALSLRHDGRAAEKPHENGMPFFVPQLAKVKTNIMCQTNNKHLLFSYEKASGMSDFNGPTSPNTSTLPYRKQGDKSYYTEENLKKRQKLMEDRKVLAGIGRFWDTFPNIRQGQATIDQKDYVDVFMKFYKALVAPHEFSIGEARKIVERDWGRDVGGSGAMSKALFFRSLFEVADIWTIGISADEYVSFLNKLFDRVTMKIQDPKTSLWVTVFAELDRIHSFAEPKESMVSVVTALAAAVAATNQDQESSSGPKASGRNSSQAPGSSSGGPGSSAGPSSSTVSKPRPPLLKKTLSSADNILLSEEAPVILTGGGGSFRRLPEIAMPAATTSAASDSAIGDQQTKSSTKEEEQRSRLEDSSSSAANGASSSRRDDKNLRSPSPKTLAGTGDNDNNSDGTNASSSFSSSSSSTSVGPITYRQSRFTRTGSLKGDLISPSRRSAFSDSAKESDGSTSRPTASDLPPQPIRLAMPSIYLSPDLTESQAMYRAARRRIRESSKLAQRLRRITF